MVSWQAFAGISLLIYRPIKGCRGASGGCTINTLYRKTLFEYDPIITVPMHVLIFWNSSVTFVILYVIEETKLLIQEYVNFVNLF